MHSLDPPTGDLSDLLDGVAALATRYVAEVGELPVVPPASRAELRERWTGPVPLDGAPVAELLRDCHDLLFTHTRHQGHPRFFGYVSSPSSPVGAVGDLVASLLNPNVNNALGAPGPAQMEHTVLGWLAEALGFPSGSGLLTSGGSMANLTALYVATRRAAAVGEHAGEHGLWGATPMTVYASAEAHHSVVKAADVLGLGRSAVREIPVDAAFRMSLPALRAAIEADLAAGLRPVCVVGTAGTTNTGAVDPLAGIAGIAGEFGLWFHVDGAYGAPARLDPAKRRLLDGIELADSLTVDAHKWLYAPVDCGVLLYRDGAHARRAFAAASHADYINLPAGTPADDSFAFWDYGVELSRRFRALKLWLMFRYHGLTAIAGAVAHDNALAGHLAGRIEADPDLELLAPVELSTVCFRVVRPGADLDALNEKVMLAVQASGEAFVSQTTVGGHYALRVCVTNFRATRDDVDRTLEAVLAAARGAGEPYGGAASTTRAGR
ncbi:aminotransferase class V-fold PLP-dependent enzyme [Streptosporangium sp. NPDC051022]|uniref:pyridoxal phosphate-dependent decarboxylase family protein n=1 Tax=Streptosporangium sp. NPDC051022 TaxID=3155752 RepID=UPI00341BE1BC